jgi:hypothetical protein
MILDWHSHIYTPEEAADDLRTWDGNTGPSWGERGCPMVLENFVRAHKENNIDISVVTNAAHYLKGKRADEELPSVQAWSDYAAKVQQGHKGMLYSFRHHPALRRTGLHQGDRARHQRARTEGHLHPLPATRGIIPTTTRRGRSGSWFRTSTCR